MTDRRTDSTPPESEIADDRSVAQVVADLTRHVGELVRDETELAKAELRSTTTRLLRDLVYFAIGLVLLSVAAITLIDALVYALGLAMPLWLAALLAGAVFAVIALVVLLRGANDLRRGGFLPKETARSVRDDAEMIGEKTR